MKHIRILLGLLLTMALSSHAMPVRIAYAIKAAATRVRAIKPAVVARVKSTIRTHAPSSRRFIFSAPRFTPSSKNLFTHRIAPLSLRTLSATTAALYFKEEANKKKSEAEHKEYMQDVVTIFAHGMKSSAKAGLHRHIDSQRPGAFIQGPLTTFDFKDTIKASTASLGQEDDVKKLEETCEAFPDQRKILVGSSRGAATCMNYLGARQTPHIGAAVVESPFASLETLVRPSFKPLFRWLFPQYNPKGLQPINVAPSIAKDIPILIFCSKDDEVVPVSQSIDLYKALRSSGHDKSHLLILDHGAHAKILIDKDGKKVRDTIHAFYRNYNIPHNDSWADAGQETFKQCQPSDELLATIRANAKVSTWKSVMRMSGSASGSR